MENEPQMRKGVTGSGKTASRRTLTRDAVVASICGFVVVFMVGASHFYVAGHFSPDPGGGKWFVYFAFGLAVLAILEANALGKISGRGNTGLNVIYESHINAMYAGFGILIFLYLVGEILLRN